MILHVEPIFKPIEVLLQIILNQYFTSSYCLSVVSEHSLNFSFNNSFNYILVINGQIQTKQLLKVSENGCSDYIVLMKDPKKFMVAFEEVNHIGNARRSDRKIVFLPYHDDEDAKKVLLDILTLKETTFVANILLILPSLEQSVCYYFDLVTHKYVGLVNETKQPFYLDRFNSCSLNFEKYANLFPHDLTNLYGKTIKVASFTYKPYILLDIDKSKEPLGRDGTEMRMIEEFCRWINCTIEIIRDDNHEWGEIYDNKTGDGVMGNIFQDRADLGVAGLLSWYEIYPHLDFSTPDIRTAITGVVPSPRLLASWEMPLLPFSGYMWLAVFFTFIYASIALILAKGFSSDRVFLTTFGMMITQSQFDVGASWRIRSVTIWMLLTGLVIDNAYGGGLAFVFTVPKYEKPIDTLQDIVDHRLEWGATHDSWVSSLRSSTEPFIQSLVSYFRVFPAEVLKKKSQDRSMALLIERLPSGYFAIGDYITKEAMLDLTLMQDDFYYQQCVVMLRKSSPYTNKINNFIGRLHESGLIIAWETQVALKYMNYKVQLEVRLSRSQNDRNIGPLNLQHVVGIFILYAIGVILSIIIFILEITI